MTGNELIIITIEDGDKRISTSYSVMQADLFNGKKGEYHFLSLDNLVKRFNDSMEKDIPWPNPLGEILKKAGIGITIDEETKKRNFEDGIRYFQG
jgi:hypothetical protein